MLKGRIVYDFPEVEKIRKYSLEQLKMLPEEYKKINCVKKYPVRISPRLSKLMDELYQKWLEENG